MDVLRTNMYDAQSVQHYWEIMTIISASSPSCTTLVVHIQLGLGYSPEILFMCIPAKLNITHAIFAYLMLSPNDAEIHIFHF